MSSNVYTAKFAQTLPRGPLVQHLLALHEMMYWGGIYGDALAIAEHHLRSIAVYSQENEKRRYYESPLYHAELEAKRRRDALRAQPQGAVPDIATALERAFANFEASLKKMRKAQFERTPERQEAAAVRQYEAKIKAERAAGLAHVKSEAARVRRELGL